MTATISLNTLLLSVLLVSCTQPKQTNQEIEKPSVPVFELTRQDAEIDHDYAGHIEAVQNVEVRARVAGYLDNILVDEGHPVRKGQLLFQLNPVEFRMKVDQALAYSIRSLRDETKFH